jgi:anaerobic ribonucleoside-triphosphate reductase
LSENGGGEMNNNVVKNVNGKVGEGVEFERIRRITGYLVGTLDRFNNGKRAEVEDRVKHGLSKH